MARGGSTSVVAIVAILLAAQHVHGFDTPDCVYLTVSSLWTPKEQGRPLIERELELNWVLDPLCDSPERVGLFSQDPRSAQDAASVALFWADTELYPDGFIKSNVSLGRDVPLPGGWDDGGAPGDHCYPYWIASFNASTLLFADCLKIRPTWMADHREELSRLTLSQLLIPGTHNSACYHQGNKTTPGRDAFSRFLLTQDTDLWSQLVHGVRYLDLRVGYYANSNTSQSSDRFWVNHAMVRVSPLVPVLRQVARFVAASPGEVVIVDFHRFPIGLDGRRKRHRQLVALLRKELGPLALSPPQHGTPSLGDVWKQPKRLVVAYGDRQAAADSKWLWPPLPQLWGSQQTASGLRTYMEEVMEKPRRDTTALWAVMAELTPTPFEVLFDVTGSLRQMADAVNRNLTHWVRDIWWERANIVASDFFLGNNLVDVAVRTNLHKAMLDKMDGI